MKAHAVNGVRTSVKNYPANPATRSVKDLYAFAVIARMLTNGDVVMAEGQAGDSAENTADLLSGKHCGGMLKNMSGTLIIEEC